MLSTTEDKQGSLDTHSTLLRTVHVNVDNVRNKFLETYCLVPVIKRACLNSIKQDFSQSCRQLQEVFCQTTSKLKMIRNIHIVSWFFNLECQSCIIFYFVFIGHHCFYYWMQFRQTTRQPKSTTVQWCASTRRALLWERAPLLPRPPAPCCRCPPTLGCVLWFRWKLSNLCVILYNGNVHYTPII